MKLKENRKQFNKQELLEAIAKVGCTEAQGESLWDLLIDRASVQKSSNLLNTIYYLGGLIIFYSLMVVLYRSYSSLSKVHFFLVSLGYFLSFYAAGIFFWKIKKNEVVGGIFTFISLNMIAIAVFAFLDMRGLWKFHFVGEYVFAKQLLYSGTVLIEGFTIFITIITLYWIRFPLLTAILYYSSWYMIEDVLPICLKTFSKAITIHGSQPWISVFYGVTVSIMAFLLDRKGKPKFAFWAYLIGLNAFICGIAWIHKTSELEYFTYCLMYVLLLILGNLLNRKAFLVFGVIGIIYYLQGLVIRHMSNLFMLSIVLVCVGIAIIGVAIFCSKKQKKSAGRKLQM